MIVGDATPMEVCKYEGIFVHCDPHTRVISNSAVDTSLKRQRAETTALDMVLIDFTGPVLFSLLGHGEVSSFIQNVKTQTASPNIASIDMARVTELVKNNWNGSSLTSVHLLV